MRALALIPLLLALAACDSGAADEDSDDTALVSGRYSGVGVPADARQASVILDFGAAGVSAGTSTAGLFFRILDGRGNSIEEVSGTTTITLQADGTISLDCACIADFRGSLPVQGSGTVSATGATLTFTGGVRMANVSLTKQ